jgi:hypothetical protein
LKDLFEGKGQPWRLGKFFGDVTFAIRDGGLGFEKELAGACIQKSLKVDRFVTQELMNNLFNSKKVAEENNINLKGIQIVAFPCFVYIFAATSKGGATSAVRS